MAIVTMDSAGKIVVPQVLRDHLALKPGDRIELRLTRDGRVIMDKAYAERRVSLAGEPERSVVRPGRIRIRHNLPEE